MSIYADFEKIKAVISEKLELEKEEITLDLEIFHHEFTFYTPGYSNFSHSAPLNITSFFASGGKITSRVELYNGRSVLDLLICLEETFEIEINEEDFDEMKTVKDLLEYLLQKIHGINLEEFDLLEKARMEEARSREIERKTLKLSNFLARFDIKQQKIIEFLRNPYIISHYNKIQEFRKALIKPGVQANDIIIEFAELFQNNFLVSHLEEIGKILQFLDETKISRDEALEMIQSGMINSCRDRIISLNNSIYQKEIEIENKKIDIENKKSELKQLLSELDILKQQREVFFAE